MGEEAVMKKLITYTKEQVQQIRGLLNGVAVMGVQNCKQIAVIAQILDSGIPADVNVGKPEKKEGEG